MMSDHGSAYIYGTIFRYLGKVGNPAARKAAKKFWKDSFQCDFSPEDMYADAALKKLGLAKRGIHPDYHEPTTLYALANGRLP